MCPVRFVTYVSGRSVLPRLPLLSRSNGKGRQFQHDGWHEGLEPVCQPIVLNIGLGERSELPDVPDRR
jgi:hypothetical protein